MLYRRGSAILPIGNEAESQVGVSTVQSNANTGKTRGTRSPRPARSSILPS
jgi:hypothetical protein